jgi:hypothetical protein
MIFIDNLESWKCIYQPREVSTTPRDIARGVSPEDTSISYIPDPLRRTWKGRINPTPKSKQQLKKARQAENRNPTPKSMRQLNKARQAENRKKD